MAAPEGREEVVAIKEGLRLRKFFDRVRKVYSAIVPFVN